MKTVVSYYGGKQRMVRHIIPLIPQHTVYVEPFCGGAAVFFNKPCPVIRAKAHYREIINDVDSRLINFYRQLRDNGDALAEKIQLTPYSQEEHRISLKLDSDDPVENARRYYVNIMQGFANKLNAGWGRNVVSGNAAANWSEKIDKIKDFIGRMQGVFIACDDALKIIRQWDSPQTFFYCDPPYPGTDCGHYKGYTIENFKNLITTLDGVQGSFLLSNYDQPDAKIPSDWERFEFSSFNSARGRVNYDRSKKVDESDQNRSRTEVVWRRFNRKPVRPEIQKLYDSGAFDCFVKIPRKESNDDKIVRNPEEELW